MADDHSNAHSTTTDSEAGDLWAARHEYNREVDDGRDPRILFRRADSKLILSSFYRSSWEEGSGSPSSTIEVEVSTKTGERRMLRHECGLTGRAFLLPVGMPTPGLIYTSVSEEEEGGGVISEEVAQKVHPDFLSASHEEINSAIRDRVDEMRTQASHLLLDAHELESLLGRAVENRHP
jgi:hypothetical protein